VFSDTNPRFNIYTYDATEERIMWATFQSIAIGDETEIPPPAGISIIDPSLGIQILFSVASTV
jgi:hypothetical protein